MGGKEYWSEHIRALGVVEEDGLLRVRRPQHQNKRKEVDNVNDDEKNKDGGRGGTVFKDGDQDKVTVQKNDKPEQHVFKKAKITNDDDEDTESEASVEIIKKVEKKRDVEGNGSGKNVQEEGSGNGEKDEISDDDDEIHDPSSRWKPFTSPTLVVGKPKHFDFKGNASEKETTEKETVHDNIDSGDEDEEDDEVEDDIIVGSIDDEVE
jgi:hypothetical protein